MRPLRRILLTLALLLFAPSAGAAESLPTFEALSGIGQWPTLSEPVAFRNRLWFANAVKGRNHNSADLYSYDPWRDEIRYERHLFSQAAGKPLVAGGLLYWPMEDARWSLGWGHVEVTDGEDWRLLTIPSATSFHSHAMAESRGRLVAATSAWRAGLQLSDDRGLTWRQAYDHPTPERRVSRIVRLASLDGLLFGALVTRDRRAILRMAPNADAVAEAPGLPSNKRTAGLVTFDGRLHTLLREPQGWALWAHDGDRAERISLGPKSWRGPVLGVGAGAVWVAEGGGTEARLWRSVDGKDWQPYARLPDGRPTGIAALGGAIFVTGRGADGRSILWAERPIGAAPAPPPKSALPKDRVAALGFEDWEAAGAALDAVLDDPAHYERHGGTLRDLVFALARAAPPDGFFTARLARKLPGQRLSLIGGAVEHPAADLGRWMLLWGMAIAGRGPVPIALLTEPWSMPANPSEKYFAAPPAALASAALIGQRDRATIEAMIDRLARPGEPAWLKADALGALNAVTGERFGVDVAAWQAWWQRVGDTWSP